jgi:UDP-glucuronate 4-epimerase
MAVHADFSTTSAGCVVVTGAAGFIGSHVSSALLSRGQRVIGVDNFDPFYDRALKRANIDRILEAPQQTAAKERATFTLVEADIRDRDAMRDLFAAHRPQGVIQLAALAGVRPSIADPARYVSVNLDGTASVLDAARAAGCRRVAFASSSSVYGNNRKVPFAETDPVDEPISPYAATKRAGELLCFTYSHLFSLSIVCLRFFTVFGPAQRPDLAIGSFMRLIADEQPVPMFGDGSSSRDYTFIADIVAGVLAAYDRTAQGAGPKQPGCRIYNLGGSHPVTLREMIERIGEVVGKTPRIKQMPMQPGDVERTYADLSRSGAELGYRPQTSFVDGLRRQWQWTREHAPAAVSA